MSVELPEPRNNPHLEGHDEAEQAFLGAWNTKRLAHAWLLTGPKGIGKATLAYRIARFVLDQGRFEGQGAGLFGAPPPPTSLFMAPEEPLFHRISMGGHLDCKVVERGVNDQGKPRTEIVVEDVRGLGQFLSLTPAEGGWRLVIVDAVDEMNRSAANAILKLLEEPPARSLLLLVCHQPGRILPTIRSRCRRLALSPLPEDLSVRLMGRYAPEIPSEEARSLIRLAEGSLGRALDLHAEGGLGLYREMIDLLKAVPRMDIPALHAFGDRLSRADGAMAFQTLSNLFSGWLARLARQGGGGRVAEVVTGEGEIMARLLARSSLDRWVELWEKLNHQFQRAEAVHLDRKQVVLSAFLSVEKIAAG
ncbi:MAG: DNA polymerase III subunit delta' [Rhodospirillales bacterium]|jgi:DNA polymerase-3 subunit delta'|nr:DNA polymerase III subunit delta' [Rhodospirillales bacterium]